MAEVHGKLPSMTRWARCGTIGEVRVLIRQEEMVNYFQERMKKYGWIRFGKGDMAGEVRDIFVCRTAYRKWYLDMKVVCRTNKWHHDDLSHVLNEICAIHLDVKTLNEILASAQEHMATNTDGVNATTVPPPPPPPPRHDDILASAQELMMTNTVGVNATSVPQPPPPPQRARDGQLQLKHPWRSRDTPFPPLFTVRDQRYKWRRLLLTDDDDNCRLSNLVI